MKNKKGLLIFSLITSIGLTSCDLFSNRLKPFESNSTSSFDSTNSSNNIDSSISSNTSIDSSLTPDLDYETEFMEYYVEGEVLRKAADNFCKPREHVYTISEESTSIENKIKDENGQYLTKEEAEKVGLFLNDPYNNSYIVDEYIDFKNKYSYTNINDKLNGNSFMYKYVKNGRTYDYYSANEDIRYYDYDFVDHLELESFIEYFKIGGIYTLGDCLMTLYNYDHYHMFTNENDIKLNINKINNKYYLYSTLDYKNKEQEGHGYINFVYDETTIYNIEIGFDKIRSEIYHGFDGKEYENITAETIIKKYNNDFNKIVDFPLNQETLEKITSLEKTAESNGFGSFDFNIKNVYSPIGEYQYNDGDLYLKGDLFKNLKHVKPLYYLDKEHTKLTSLPIKIPAFKQDLYIDFDIEDGYALVIKEDAFTISKSGHVYDLNQDRNLIFEEINLNKTNTYHINKIFPKAKNVFTRVNGKNYTYLDIKLVNQKVYVVNNGYKLI